MEHTCSSAGGHPDRSAFLISYEADVRTGGAYRLVMGHPTLDQPMAFFGRCIEVTPHSRLVWTNDEEGGGGAVTTVSFEERDGATRVVVHELYSSKAALDEAVASGSTSGWGEQFEQLENLLACWVRGFDGQLSFGVRRFLSYQWFRASSEQS